MSHAPSLQPPPTRGEGSSPPPLVGGGWRERRAGLTPYLLLLPSLLFLTALFFVPLVQTIALAFHGDGGWNLGNFTRMAGDLNFLDAVENTFSIVVVVVPLQLALALGMAMMLRHINRGRDLVLWP